MEITRPNLCIISIDKRMIIKFNGMNICISTMLTLEFYDKCLEKGIRTVSEGNFGAYRTILDCIFGTGFRGEVKEPARSAIEKINSSGAYVVSADINSGLNGDTGLGDLYVRSDLTVSIGTFKYGHFLGNAKEAMKDKVNCDIGIKIIGETRELS